MIKAPFSGSEENYLALGSGCNLFYYKAIQKCKHKYITYKSVMQIKISLFWHHVHISLTDMTNCCSCRLHRKCRNSQAWERALTRLSLTLIDVAYWRTWQLVGYTNPGMVAYSKRRLLMLARGYLDTCQESWSIKELTRELCFIMDLDVSQRHSHCC